MESGSAVGTPPAPPAGQERPTLPAREEKSGRKAGINRRYRHVWKRHFLKLEIGWGAAGKYGNRVFELRALQADIGGLRFGILQLGFGLILIGLG